MSLCPEQKDRFSVSIYLFQHSTSQYFHERLSQGACRRKRPFIPGNSSVTDAMFDIILRTCRWILNFLAWEVLQFQISMIMLSTDRDGYCSILSKWAPDKDSRQNGYFASIQ